MPHLSKIGGACSQAYGFTGLIRPSVIQIDYMVAGCNGSATSWGGIAGGLVSTGSFLLKTTSSVSVTVGTSGASSTFNGITAAGGNDTSGNDGASNPSFGGGSGATWGWDDSTYTFAGGGGAGANQAGGNGSIADVVGQQQPTSGKGGDGKQWTVNGQYYGGGHQGGTYSAPGASQFGGGNGLGAENFGGTGGGAIASYLSTAQLFTGGTVTSTGVGIAKRWFHSFPASSSLVPLY